MLSMLVIQLARAQTRPKARTHLSIVFTKRLIVPRVRAPMKDAQSSYAIL